jgi:hypothetical protein
MNTGEKMSDYTSEMRWRDLHALQRHYSTFDPFLTTVMEDLLGFNCTDVQRDIGCFLETGPLNKMIQAQRGQAKTTITAAYAVWRLIHDPSVRILIISAGDTQATEVSSMIVQIIAFMEELEPLRPDTSHGDRSSVKAFDVHWQLKGPEKSPSVACVGINSNLQGKRADVLIADDIESKKNSATGDQREKLVELTRDFTSICSNGDIIYLGTPQSIDSVYNGLHSRGYTIRIWPGRYPTVKETENYGSFLAPFITEKIANDPSLQTGGGINGDRGKPIDPIILDEDALVKKELDQGKAYFQLQHMLDTKLMDADRYPLKPHKIMFMPMLGRVVPYVLHPSFAYENMIRLPVDFCLRNQKFYRVTQHGSEFSEFKSINMYVDPAGGGQNGDELAYAITGFLAGKIYVLAVGGFKGGYEEATLLALTQIVVKHRPNSIHIEKNYGNGAFYRIWKPYLDKELLKIDHKAGIEEVWESGQKELRIIDVLEPIIDAGRLIMNEDIIEDDHISIQQYPAEKRTVYSLFYQLARITREKGALKHDDRLDALAGSCRTWTPMLMQDAKKQAEDARKRNYEKMMKDPLGTGRNLSHKQLLSSTAKFKRKF